MSYNLIEYQKNYDIFYNNFKRLNHLIEKKVNYF